MKADNQKSVTPQQAQSSLHIIHSRSRLTSIREQGLICLLLWLLLGIIILRLIISLLSICLLIISLGICILVVKFTLLPLTIHSICSLVIKVLCSFIPLLSLVLSLNILVNGLSLAAFWVLGIATIHLSVIAHLGLRLRAVCAIMDLASHIILVVLTTNSGIGVLAITHFEIEDSTAEAALATVRAWEEWLRCQKRQTQPHQDL